MTDDDELRLQIEVQLDMVELVMTEVLKRAPAHLQHKLIAGIGLSLFSFGGNGIADLRPQIAAAEALLDRMRAAARPSG